MSPKSTRSLGEPTLCQSREMQVPQLFSGFLVYIIESKGRPREDQGRDRSSNRKQLQCFLGVANFYRRFIGNYSRVAAALTRLTSTPSPLFGPLKRSLPSPTETQSLCIFLPSPLPSRMLLRPKQKGFTRSQACVGGVEALAGGSRATFCCLDRPQASLLLSSSLAIVFSHFNLTLTFWPSSWTSVIVTEGTSTW